MAGMGLDLGTGCGGGGNTLYGPLSFRDEYTTSRATAAVNATDCEPGTGTREVTDTETCISIIPNLSAAVATHAGVTFGGSNNRCSYAVGYGWMDFPTGFNASLQAGLGRLAVMYDSSGRACWGFLGAGGSGETFLEKITNTDFTASTGWVLTAAASIGSGVLTETSEAAYTNFAYIGNVFIASSAQRLYNINLDVSISTGNFTIWLSGIVSITSINSSVVNLYRVLSSHGNNNFILNNGPLSGTGTVDNVSCRQVLTPSATGCWVYPTLAKALAGDTAQSGWNKPTAFNTNSIKTVSPSCTSRQNFPVLGLCFFSKVSSFLSSL